MRDSFLSVEQCRVSGFETGAGITMKLFTVFLLLLFGYAGLIAIGIGIDQLIPLKEAGFAGKILLCLFLTGIFFYPPVSLSYFFSKQLNSKLWKNVTGLAALCGMAFFIWAMLGFQTGDASGYANLTYFITGVAAVFLLSTTITGLACLSKRQIRTTRVLGTIALVSPGYTPLFWSLKKVGLLDIDGIVGELLFNPFLFSSAVILLAIISALSNAPSKPKV